MAWMVAGLFGRMTTLSAPPRLRWRWTWSAPEVSAPNKGPRRDRSWWHLGNILRNDELVWAVDRSSCVAY